MNLRVKRPIVDLEEFERRPDPYASAPSTFDINAVLHVLRARRNIILGTAGAVVAAALLVLLSVVPTYSATAVMMIDQRRNAVADVNAVLSGLATDSASVQNQIQILLFNLNGGIAPSTNFGLQSQIHINLGFTTSLKKKWSAHLLYGFGKIWVTDEKFDLKKENEETITYYYVYPLWPGLDHIVYAGTFFKPLREKNFCVGLDVSLSSTGIGNNYLFTVSSVDGPSASKANYIKTKPFGVFIKLSYLIKRKI